MTDPVRIMQRLLVLFLILVSCHAVFAQTPATAGQWNTLQYLMPINPVHVALLHNGKVLVVSGSGNYPANLINNILQAGVWDPQAGTISVQNVSWDMFCNGMIVLADGRPFINGGTIQYDPFLGSQRSSIFDPVTNTFSNVANMAHGRWYPTTTLLGDGTVMTFSGLDTNGSTTNTVEIFNPSTGTWSPSYTASWTPPLYPRLHLLPNGNVFYSGPSAQSAIFNNSNHTWTLGATTNYGGTRTYGSSVLLPLTPANNYSPKVMIMGGGNPATNTTEIIDLSVAKPKWQYAASMYQGRIEMNATLLPNGQILTLGGSINDEDATTAGLQAQIYDPSSNTFKAAGSEAYARLYHSVSLLMPDGTVWVAGGNPQRNTYEPHMEIYSPPYLFTQDANGNTLPAVRPTISSTPPNVAYGISFSVGTPDAAAISSVVLMRNGSPTHAFDQDQRMVGLSFTAGSGFLTVTAPPNSNIAPPGYYMLFLVNSSGVPSVASFVQVSSGPQAAVPTFSPAPGTYSSSQSVSISDSTAGATIYYTTDGSTPTTASPVYSTAIPVSTTTTINAIAAASGYSNSAVASGTYVIGNTPVNYSSGFTAVGLTFNGAAVISGSRLRLTDGGANEAASAYFSTPVNVQAFTTNFSLQMTSAMADGMTFVIQGSGSTALGPLGGGLGYGPDSTTGAPGIPTSVAVKFDIYNNAGEGSDSTGMYTDGASPTTPAVDMTASGVNPVNGDVYNVQITYDGTTLAMSITDSKTNAQFSTSWTVNIPGIVGGNTAYVGFTGGTGGYTAIQDILNWTYSTSPAARQAATPIFSPAPGTYSSAQNVTISDTTTGATIYYTTDGSTPTTASAVYSTAIPVSTTTTIKAIAAASGYTTSNVGSALYTIQVPTAATPTFSPVAGTYTSAQNVTISDATTGATIYYTTDGSTPTTASAVYSTPIQVSTTTTIKAIAAASGYTTSNVGSALYTIQLPKAATPTFSPVAGTYTSAQNVTISDTTTGATIYYTTDGSTPTTASVVYSTPIQVSTTTTIKAIAAASGYTTSNVGSALYTIQVPTAATPTFSPVAGTYTSAQSVTISDTTTGATIYYTTNGSTPTTASAVYTGAIAVNSTTAIKAMAAAAGYSNSSVASATYTLTVATPTLSPVAGTYNSPQSVTISDTTPGATIYYTSDGSTPSTASTVYTGAIAVTSNITIKAMAAEAGYTNSAVASATYTIQVATPSINPASGTYSSPLSVTMSDSTPGATIYYTTNGTTPTTSSIVYSGPITLTKNTNIKVMAAAAGYSNSSVASASYKVR